jgi:hypothetical protein
MSAAEKRAPRRAARLRRGGTRREVRQFGGRSGAAPPRPVSSNWPARIGLGRRTGRGQGRRDRLRRRLLAVGARRLSMKRVPAFP